MANTAKHAPGDDSIDEVTPKRQADGVWMIRWMWWPYDGGPPRKQRHQGNTAGEARAKARAKLAELKAGTTGGRWTKASKLSDYIEQVVRPAVAGSSKLSDSSKALYGRSLNQLDAELGKLAIAKAIEFRVAEGALLAIAERSGSSSAKTARNVLNRWVFGQMKRDRLIVQSPLADMDIDLGTNKTTTKTANDVALAEADYDRLLDHLLAFDADAVELPPRSRAAAREKIRGAVDITLLLMTTGMRLGSARQIEPHEVIDNASGGVNVVVPAAKLKGERKRPITFTVLDDRVAERVKALRKDTPAGSYILGAPADKAKLWDRRNCTREIERLYVSLADELGIKELRSDIRSHGWRTTLNTLYYHLPAHVRAEWFGHTEAVNAAHYVAAEVDLSPMVAAAKERRLRVVGE
ncbi:hypothetical protein nbrc107696_27050 [Gordonia spumicola]|uniref:Tyr recombinase domain-containing protein n=1 Tax=Gordonia spumicola TaxID=589161 RepID=A0A7I9VAA2_9ACTN|nr:site-specific integrase [Gordonia spumicola]GEE02259.1 hypothetical protein nbrc107696_27050 [Gordonia spumicola]